MTTSSAKWSSYWTFIFATAGAAVGLGNIWKFPYIAGENGGGAFVLIYLIFVLFIGIPLMTAEVMMGRRGGGDPKTSMSSLISRYKASPVWQGLGYMLVLAGFLILSYYSVIAGWATAYVFKSASGQFLGLDATSINSLFDSFVSSPTELAIWHTIVVAATVGVVSLGLDKGLEKAVVYMFPAMLVLLLIIVGYSLSTNFFAHGLSFLFYPDFSKLTTHGILVAVGHAFFTLSLASGSIMMYGAYLPEHISIPKTSFFIALADTLIALVAGLAIFPIVFAHGLEPGAGPGLIFKTLPLAFGHMSNGLFFGTLFFLMLVFAAFTSAISLLEPSVAFVVNQFKWSRAKSSAIVGFLIWLLGFATVFSFNHSQNIMIFGLTCFDFLDSLTSNYMLPIGGLLIALFAAWLFKDSAEELEWQQDSQIFKVWKFSLGVVTPIAIMIVFLFSTGIFKWIMSLLA